MCFNRMAGKPSERAHTDFFSDGRETERRNTILWGSPIFAHTPAHLKVHYIWTMNSNILGRFGLGSAFQHQPTVFFVLLGGETPLLLISIPVCIVVDKTSYFN